MNRLKVLVTGATGQLGKDIIELLIEKGYEVFGYGRDQLDVTEIEQINIVFKTIKPDVVIHSAAYTKVDQAESEPDEAYRVNAFGTRNIAIASEEIGSKLVYISTDYVFSGDVDRPYNEYDLVNPINVYGKSKLAGEVMVRDFHSRFFIVRTSWVYGKHGNNFVKTMLRLAKEKDTISVVNDQIGSPTYTVDLASKIEEIFQTQKYGIYHVSNSGSCSWYDFAKAIFEEYSIDWVEVIPIKSNQFLRMAKRPLNSVFDQTALRINGFNVMRNWRAGLKDFLKGIKNEPI